MEKPLLPTQTGAMPGTEEKCVKGLQRWHLIFLPLAELGLELRAGAEMIQACPLC